MFAFIISAQITCWLRSHASLTSTRWWDNKCKSGVSVQKVVDIHHSESDWCGLYIYSVNGDRYAVTLAATSTPPFASRSQRMDGRVDLKGLARALSYMTWQSSCPGRRTPAWSDPGASASFGRNIVN